MISELWYRFYLKACPKGMSRTDCGSKLTPGVKMAKPVSTHQRGFTLIEMSIVLVIIGLIIGGILKGQELIESSRQKNLISQIDRLRSGTTTFTDRFRSLPGDFRRVSQLPNNASLGSLGNENGIIGATASSAITDLASLAVSTVLANENVQYFNQLIAADLGSNGTIAASGVTIACFTGLCGTPSPLPNSAFPSSGLTINHGPHIGGTNGGTTVAVSKMAHWLIVSRFVTANLAGGSTDGVMSPARAFQVDNKYDDGGAGTGNIRSSFVGTGCGNSTTDYGPTGTDTQCHLMFALE